MRYLITLFLLLCSILSFSQQSTFVKKLPNRHNAVNDFGRFLTSNEKDSLAVELKDYLERTSNAIVVVTLESLTDPETEKEYTIEEAGLLYFNTWGVGDKEKNNGVLLIASRNPRRVRIQVGTGLENNLTNEYCQEIVDNNLVPYFKEGQFFTGIKQAIAAIENRLDHPQQVDQKSELPSYLKPTVIPTVIRNEVNTHYGKGSPVTVLAIIGGILVVCILFIKFGRPLSSGWYTRNGYVTNDWGWYNNHSTGRGWSGSGSSFSSGGSSSGGGGSYGGGSSSGGGASGSW